MVRFYLNWYRCVDTTVLTDDTREAILQTNMLSTLPRMLWKSKMKSGAFILCKFAKHGVLPCIVNTLFCLCRNRESAKCNSPYTCHSATFQNAQKQAQEHSGCSHRTSVGTSPVRFVLLPMFPLGQIHWCFVADIRVAILEDDMLSVIATMLESRHARTSLPSFLPALAKQSLSQFVPIIRLVPLTLQQVTFKVRLQIRCGVFSRCSIARTEQSGKWPLNSSWY